jgi:hypothetical protein
MATPPTERQILTALINSISSTAPSPAQHARDERRYDTEQPRNALSDLPEGARSLLMTLHVIYPSLVLPALDLLDRKLVIKLRLVGAATDDQRTSALTGPADFSVRSLGHSEVVAESSTVPDPVHARRTAASSSLAIGKQQQLYVVQSGQNIFTRRTWQSDVDDGGDGSENAARSGVAHYLVHLEAWNCSCVGFAFAAYPVTEATTPFPKTDVKQAENKEEQAMEEQATDEERSVKDVGEGDDGGQDDGGEGRDSDHSGGENSSGEKSYKEHGEGEDSHSDVDSEEVWMAEDELLALETDSDEQEGAWEFGGRSIETVNAADDSELSAGKGGDGMPCCKHLLACLLADRWESVLGSYVTERVVERAELAGIVAEI